MSEVPQEVRNPIRVFLVERKELVRRGLKDFIEDQPDISVVGESDSVEHGVALISKEVPDLVIVGSDSDVDWNEMLRRIAEGSPNTRCLALSNLRDRPSVVGSIKAGAAGYVLQPAMVSTILDAIRTIADGRVFVDPLVTDIVIAEIRGVEDPDDYLTRLTRQERLILHFIAHGLHDKQIAEKMKLNEKTVRNYVSNLLAKLNVDSRTKAAVLAISLDDDLKLDEGLIGPEL